MRSDVMRKGIEKAPHRSLFKAMEYTQAELNRPIIGIVNSANEIIPGHIHLDKITEKERHWTPGFTSCRRKPVWGDDFVDSPLLLGNWSLLHQPAGTM